MKQFTKSLFIVLSVLFSFSNAFAETGSETENNATGGGASNAQVDGQSYYVAGTYIAGKGSAQTGNMTSKGFKLRTGTDGARAVFSVQTGYTITKLSLEGASNYAKQEGAETNTKVIKVEVDGVEVAYTGGEDFQYRGEADAQSCNLTIDNIQATESIAIYFDNSGSQGSQINASWAIDWERPDATQPTITVSPKAVALVPGASFKLTTRVDPTSFTTGWATDAPAVASVAEDGTVTALAAGVANIMHQWNEDATVADTAVITVADFDAEKYNIVKQFDFTTMGDITLTIEETAAGNIWNEGNNKPNAVYFCTNEGLKDIAVQAVLSGGKGWSITSEGLLLASGAGRCAAIGHLTAGQVVEIIYTGSAFYTGSKEDATRKDDGAVKTALNQGIGRAIYKMEEDGLLGFEITKGKAIEKIIVYEAAAVPLPEIVNASFDANPDDVITVTTQGYQRNIPDGSDQITGLQPVTGWTAGTQTESDPGYVGGVFAYGSENLLNNKVTAPAAAPEGSDSPSALGLAAVWGGVAQYTQDVTMPAGDYKLKYTVYNGVNTGEVTKNLFGFIAEDKTEYLSTAKTFTVGEWTEIEVAFSLSEETTGKISVGFIGAGGSGNAPHLFVDNVKLVQVAAIETALIELKAAIDAAKAKLASYPIGDVYFTYPAEELAGLSILIGIAEATYNAAESVEAVKKATKDLNDYVATFKPIMQIPTEGKAYYIANKTAEGNLCIGTEKVTIAKDAAVFFTKVEGGFVLSNEEGNYILKTADNNWTLSTTTNKDEAYVVNFNFVDGDYTIQGAKGLFGTDNAAEGSAVYANKAQTNNGLWTITAKPEFKPAYGTLWTEADGSSVDENEFNYITLENKYFKGLAKVGDTIKVAISHVGEQAEGSRSLVITEGTLKLKIDNTDETQTIQQGTTSTNLIFTEEEIAKIQEGADVILSWKYMTVATVELVEFKKEQLINNGTYYIAAAEHISSENPTYMAAGKSWGTQGIVNNVGLDLDVTYNTASKDYYIDTRISNGGNNHYLGSGLYMDSPAFGWMIEEVTNGFNIYGMFDGVKKYVSAANDGNLTLSETPYPWIFIHISNWNSLMRATLNEATAENGVDATFLLKDANFNRNDQRVAAWVVSEDCTNKNLGGGADGSHYNACAESYHSTFTISQIAEGAPKGIYAVTAQGFYRQDTDGDFALPYFFANDEKADFPLKTGSENNMGDAGNSFDNGLYTIDPIYVEVAENGTLTVGTKSETANFWCIWDNFKLTYYGANATMDEVKNGAIVKELAELRAKAQNMLADIEVDAVKNAINEALTATASVTGTEAITAAIATMKAVIEKGEASIIAKNVLPKMKQLTEETNLYTAEALNAYYTQWEVKYLDGSLTKTEATTNLQDPFLVTSWHANAAANTLLMSAWDETPMNWNSYHLNTWSTEGGSDGSNFVVPFIEYWTGDGESLAEKTLTATMNGLKEDTYKVTALVRVRTKNGASAPAYGITLQVNNGDAVDVCGGAQVGNSQFYLQEFEANGAVTENGELKIKFNVAADNNISWLSFKNVKFIDQTSVGIQNVNTSKQPESIYNLSGQKVQKAGKGLYIINGKKVVLK